MLLVLASCRSVLTVEVRNLLEMDRYQEMAELTLETVTEGLALNENESFVIEDSKGDEVPYQITYDGKVIFPVIMSASGTERFTITRGVPAQVPVSVCGSHYPDKENDIAWENDLVGFRVYGHKKDIAAGYDLFAKRGTDLPVLDSFYEKENKGSDSWKRYYEIEETDPTAAYRYLMDTLSYHVDRGYGMDCYGVGPTLGAGAAALSEDGIISYPFCYDSFEILDNGPLRFTVVLKFRPFDVGLDKGVVETRTIVLDKGSHLNKTMVSYTGLSDRKTIVTGIVLQDKFGNETADMENGYVAYPAPTINADKTKDVDNGTLFVGNVIPDALEDARTVYFSEEESLERGNTKGHVMTFSGYGPGSVFIYYWGFGWDHSDVSTYEGWKQYLDTFSKQVRNPLEIVVTY